MGYTTEFEGAIRIDPPLSEPERDFLKAFCQSRRVERKSGPYAVEAGGSLASYLDSDVIDRNSPPPGQPGLWCQWAPSDNGAFLAWDGGEKFYSAREWMSYIINHFFAPGALGKSLDPGIALFGDHVFNGEILAVGESREDVWLLRVESNAVSFSRGEWPAELLEKWGEEDQKGRGAPRMSELFGYSHRLSFKPAQEVPAFAEEVAHLAFAARERSEIDQAAGPGSPCAGGASLSL